jgi:hypothetical protein
MLKDVKVVTLLDPTTTDGGANSAYLDLTEANEADIFVSLNQNVAHATVLTLQETAAATANANAKIWATEDTSASEPDSEDDGKSYTVDADVAGKTVVFKVDPASLASGKTSVRITASNSSQATNYISVIAIVKPRYS